MRLVLPGFLWRNEGTTFLFVLMRPPVQKLSGARYDSRAALTQTSIRC
jgi:hypothetical protein